MPELAITGLTHRGAQRPENEDCIVLAERIAAESMDQPLALRRQGEQPIVAAVADGMGGHAAGEVASRHVAERLRDEAATLVDGRAAADLLRRLNAEIYEAVAEAPERRGMGTTVAGVAVGTGGAVVFNVGDSRVYRLAEGAPGQLSFDDTPGPKLEDGRTAAQTTPLITQALGGLAGFAEIEPHVLQEPVAAGGRYLVCSDGLSDLVDAREIAALVGDDDAAAVSALFRAAMERGGRDNISVVLLRIERL